MLSIFHERKMEEEKTAPIKNIFNYLLWCNRAGNLKWVSCFSFLDIKNIWSAIRYSRDLVT